MVNINLRPKDQSEAGLFAKRDGSISKAAGRDRSCFVKSLLSIGAAQQFIFCDRVQSALLSMCGQLSFRLLTPSRCQYTDLVLPLFAVLLFSKDGGDAI